MSYTEQALRFSCGGEPLFGILSVPEQSAPTGVLLIVGGPQYRAGSHRQFALLARHLAANGFATLRFDYRGMGDSGGNMRSFENVNDDIAAAIDELTTSRPEIRQVVLWGLCDAASAALLYCDTTRDPRVAGLCLLNPWVRSEASLARTQVKHYYRQRLMQKDFLQKLLRGGVAIKALRGFLHNLRLSTQNGGQSATTQRSFQQRMASGLREFPGAVALILSGNDYTAKEFLEMASTSPEWQGVLTRPLTRHDLPEADHTFSTADWKRTVENWTSTWLKTLPENP